MDINIVQAQLQGPVLCSPLLVRSGCIPDYGNRVTLHNECKDATEVLCMTFILSIRTGLTSGILTANIVQSSPLEKKIFNVFSVIKSSAGIVRIQERILF